MRDSVCHRKIQTALSEFVSDAAQWDSSLSGTGAVYRLERKFSTLVGHPHSLAMANATVGIWAVFMALGIRDAEIITTPYTWGGTLAGLILTGNRPVFADIDADTLTLDPEQVARRITPETKAILAVDIYGYPCNGPALREVADKHGLVLVQDCAQSFGAFLGERHTGHWADAAVFSCSLGKALFAGEGGMIVTPHEKLFATLISQTQHPLRQIRDTPGVLLNEMALNLRINPLAAVWAEAVFGDALVGVERHRKKSAQMLALLRRVGISKTEIPNSGSARPSMHLLTFEPACDPAKIESFLKGKSLGYQLCSAPVERPLYRHEMYQDLSQKRGWTNGFRCPVAEEQCKRRLRLLKLNASRRNA